MRSKTSAVLIFVLVLAVPLGAAAKKKAPERGMLEKMEAVPCGARQRGLAGVGGVWASIGVTHVNSNEKLCPQYLLRTDDMDYEIRPTDGNHPVVLPVGHEGVFKIKSDHMFLKVEDGDRKERTYEVVSAKPISSDTTGQNSSTTWSDTTKSSADTTKSPDVTKSVNETKSADKNKSSSDTP